MAVSAMSPQPFIDRIGGFFRGRLDPIHRVGEAIPPTDGRRVGTPAPEEIPFCRVLGLVFPCLAVRVPVGLQCVGLDEVLRTQCQQFVVHLLRPLRGNGPTGEERNARLTTQAFGLLGDAVEGALQFRTGESLHAGRDDRLGRQLHTGQVGLAIELGLQIGAPDVELHEDQTSEHPDVLGVRRCHGHAS